MEAFIPPMITGAVAIVVCIINNFFQSRKTLSEFKAHIEKTDAMIEYRIDELTKRVDKHNNVIERTYRLEQDTAVQEEQIKVINHRIEDLERAGA
jgi:FtsZ-interacting cell division protein ZipA